MIGAEDHDYVRFYARHCVALCCYETIPHSNGSIEQQYCVFSGFVLSVQDEWFLVTAGHVFEQINHARSKGCVFHDWQLDDLGARGPIPHIDVDAPPPPDTIPFDYEHAFKNHYHDEESGADYAFVHLESVRYRALLTASGVEALDEKAWRIGLPDTFVKYQLFGIPADLVKQLPRPGQVSKHYVILDIEPLQPEEVGTFPHLFKGIAPDVAQSGLEGFTRLHGMSGGPIFGFGYTKNGELRYWVIALQSSWNSQTQVITGCYVKVLGDYLDWLISEIHRKKSDR